MYALLNLTVTQSMTAQQTGVIKKCSILSGGTFGKSRKEWVLLRLKIDNLVLSCLTTKEMSRVATEGAEVEYRIEAHPKYGQTFKLLSVTQLAPKAEPPKPLIDFEGNRIGALEYAQNKFNFRHIEYKPDYLKKQIKFCVTDYNGKDSMFDIKADDFISLYNSNNINCGFKLKRMTATDFQVAVPFGDEEEIQRREFYDVMGYADSQKKTRYIVFQYMKKILV